MREVLFKHRNDNGNLVVLVDNRDGYASLEVIEFNSDKRGTDGYKVSHGGFSNIDTAIETFDDVAGTFIA